LHDLKISISSLFQKINKSKDDDECQGQGDGNNCALNIATCSNTQGSYTCKCNDGYDGDGVTCNGIF